MCVSLYRLHFFFLFSLNFLCHKIHFAYSVHFDTEYRIQDSAYRYKYLACVYVIRDVHLHTENTTPNRNSEVKQEKNVWPYLVRLANHTTPYHEKSWRHKEKEWEYVEDAKFTEMVKAASIHIVYILMQVYLICTLPATKQTPKKEKCSPQYIFFFCCCFYFFS